MSIALVLQETSTPPAPPSQSQLQQDIRQTVREATEAARAAAADAKARRQDPNIIIGPMAPALPGTVIPYIPPDIPRRVEGISVAFFAMMAVIIVGLPIMRAIARRIDKGTQAVAQIPREVREQLQQISQSVDAIAIEVERISEGQRFTTKMLAEKQAQQQDVTLMAPRSPGQ